MNFSSQPGASFKLKFSPPPPITVKQRHLPIIGCYVSYQKPPRLAFNFAIQHEMLVREEVW